MLPRVADRLSHVSTPDSNAVRLFARLFYREPGGPCRDAFTGNLVYTVVAKVAAVAAFPTTSAGVNHEMGCGHAVLPFFFNGNRRRSVL